MWYAAGLKGYYTGFYKSFYKMELPEDQKKCLDEETIDNILSMEHLVADPIGAFSNIADIQEDVGVFAKMAEVMENLSTCKFE